MKTRTRTEIRIETHEKRTIRVNRHQTQATFCDACQAKVMHLSVSRAAAVLGFSETAIFRLAESGEIHSLENSVGSLMICSSSLSTIDEQIGQRVRSINRVKQLETDQED